MVNVTRVDPPEWPLALSVLYHQLPATERSLQVREALDAERCGQLSLDGLHAAWDEARRPLGAMLAISQPDATAFVWPPVVSAKVDPRPVTEGLLRTVGDWLDSSGVRFAQCLLEVSQSSEAEVLERNGFPCFARLRFLLRSFRQPLPLIFRKSWQRHPFCAKNEQRFVDVLERTYEQTLDCPALNGARSAQECLHGHRQGATFDPDLWTLFELDGRDVGLILLTAHARGREWELQYMGVAPDARGQGLGRAMLNEALHAARDAGADSLRLAVDDKNLFANALYEELGFTESARRQVHIRVGKTHSVAQSTRSEHAPETGNKSSPRVKP